MNPGPAGAHVSATRRTSHQPTISIVVPARNEARNLLLVLPELPPVYEVILVDGHSTDGTAEAALSVMPEIRIIQQTRKGKGNALACGFEAATGDIIVMFDADGSADPAELPDFVAALEAGADFAKGSRFCADGGSHDITPLRRWGNAALNSLTNVLFAQKYSDLCYGYNAFWRDTLPLLALPAADLAQPAGKGMLWGDGFEIETLLCCRVAARDLAVTEVASVERLRIHGESNLNAVSDGLRVLQTILTERWRLARRPKSQPDGVRVRSLELQEASGAQRTRGLRSSTSPETPPLLEEMIG